MEDVRAGGKIILKRALKEHGGRGVSGLMLLRMGKSGERGNGLLGCIKDGEFLE